MSDSIQQYIRLKLQQRTDENNLRSLKVLKGLVDFYSNDYLGFATDPELKRRVVEEVNNSSHFFLGSTGSRLLSGNHEYTEAIEHFLAGFYQAEAALIINSGFDANYGLLSTLPYRGDTILYDELVHASIHDGIRAGKANAFSFPHNYLPALREKLVSATGLKYVVVESVYSMDGDFAPLLKLAEICEQYDAGLIVDEAHATGLYGLKGKGRVVELGLQQKCPVRIHTFGKALGAYGAVILCSKEMKNFLINYCRPFIFSTALPFHSLATIKCAHQYLLETGEQRREKIFRLIGLFKDTFKNNSNRKLIESDTPVQSVMVSGNQNVKMFSQSIQQSGFDVRPILYPTVARGRERIRVCIHSFNTEEEVIKLAEVINSL